MATGISKTEQHGEDALTATRNTHADPFPLPGRDDQARLDYPNKLAVSQILRPLESSFVNLDRAGNASCSTVISANSFVLSDNYFALHSLIDSGKRANLVYLDPPYGTGMDFHSRGLQHAYKDDRAPATYLEYMRRRLILTREAMSDDGSLYLHIGHQMLFHLKVILDEVFGPKNFRNVIVRRKCSSKNFTRKSYPNLNDYILFYTKSNVFKWHQPTEKPEKSWIDKEYTKVDTKGRYKLVPVHAPGTRNGATGMPWKGKSPPPGKHWQFAPAKLDELDERNEIHWSKTGNPRRKVYLTSDKMLPLTDYWSKFRDAHHQSIQITGYPTEKNLEMLKVIVSSATDPGDLVIDPFCGSGTTLHAAQDLGRHWIGMDESFTAAKATLQRFRHGLTPMGDYVQKTKNSSDLLDLVTAVADSNVEVISTAKSVPDFRFLVDSELLKTQQDHVRNLAMI
jgi:adenine-specific DNA-methyltransferase